MNTVLKTDGIFVLVADAALSAREKSAEDEDLLTRSLEESVLRQLLLRMLLRLEALEKK